MVALEGAAQQAPEATAKVATLNTTTPGHSVTTLTDNAWVVDVLSSNNTGPTTLSDQTDRVIEVEGISNSVLGMSSAIKVSAGAQTMGWTSGLSTTDHAHILASIAEASSASVLPLFKTNVLGHNLFKGQIL